MFTLALCRVDQLFSTVRRLSQLELNSEEREAKDVQTEEDSKREEEESQEEREKSTKASLILNWLAKMIEHFGDGIRRVMCVEIDGLTHSTTTLKRLAVRKRKWAKPDATREGEQLQQEVEPIDVDTSEDVKMTTLLLETDFILPSEISKGMNSFYFSLLGDAFYKRKFAFYFTKSYVSFIDQKLENALTPKNEKVTRQARRGDSEKYENLLSLTVQIFTVPNIVPALVSEGNLLGILIDKLLSVFKTYVFKKTAMPGSTAEGVHLAYDSTLPCCFLPRDDQADPIRCWCEQRSRDTRTYSTASLKC